ncbi:MAG: glycosyltransferase [Planctomycetaceae bacterium]|nr:glycosyltransferase [Planctomycetaceae bacterium]
MHVAIVTAGGAGMFCGSCLHDNAWARALRDAGIETTLMPMYTPIRVDDENLTSTRVFYGGINVYLDQHLPGWKRLPTWLTRPLDASWLIKWATSYGISNDARELGEMTEAMLTVPNSPQAREGQDLVRFLIRDLKPDVIIFSNVMLCAEIAHIKAEFNGPVLCVLQGDDVFLDALHEPWRSHVFELLKPIASRLDGFLVHSRFYAEYMAGYLGIPADKFHQLPLAIDCRGHTGRPQPRGSVATIGYFARYAPEKGLKELIEAALILNQRRQDFCVVAGGYHPAHHAAYFADVWKLAAPLGNRFRDAGSPDTLAEKVALLNTYDVLSVPTPYREPKGLYVLEAWANGVPVVQPGHGHFPELIEETGAGVCVPPGDAAALAEALDRLLSDEPERRRLAQRAWEQVRERHDLPVLARRSGALLETLVNGNG